MRSVPVPEALFPVIKTGPANVTLVESHRVFSAPAIDIANVFAAGCHIPVSVSADALVPNVKAGVPTAPSRSTRVLPSPSTRNTGVRDAPFAPTKRGLEPPSDAERTPIAGVVLNVGVAASYSVEKKPPICVVDWMAIPITPMFTTAAPDARAKIP